MIKLVWNRIHCSHFFDLAKLALITAAIALSNPVIADPTSVPGATAAGIFGEGASGYGASDSMTGVMTWAYPFNLPAARGRSQPQLTLSYNSSSRDREAGYGWGLDLPVIERKPLSGNPCFAEDGTPIACGEQRRDATGAKLLSDERYTFNGQPLIFICQLPASQIINDPECGNELQPDWVTAPGWRYFRLQVEGQFSRFYLSENRRYWRVQLKGGELLELGQPPDSGTDGTEHTLENENAILRWRLVRRSDAVHKISGKAVNYIDYRWKRLGKRGLLYLTDIYDTQHTKGRQTNADFAHHTQLTWSEPNVPQTFYADPYRATPDLRLTRVAVASKPWSGKGPREIIRTYILTYQSAQGAKTQVELSRVFQLWHHSFLDAIWMEGRCNQFEDEQGNIPTNGECSISRVPPTTFEYGDGNPEFGTTSFTKVTGGPNNAVEDDRVLPYIESVGLIDFNRDGLPDFIQGWNSEMCPDNLANDGDSKGGGKNSLMISFDTDSLGCAQRYSTPLRKVTDMVSFQSTRPIQGYLNRGTSGIVSHFAYQCMDAGSDSDTTGLTHFNINRPPAFFTNSGSVMLPGPWSEGILAWSNAQYSPFRAKPLLPDYDLNLVSLDNVSALPPVGTGLVITAKIQGNYYVRVFDWAGQRVVDQAIIAFSRNEALIQQLDTSLDNNPIDNPTKVLLVHNILTTLGSVFPPEQGTGCDVDNFVPSNFHPGWSWKRTPSGIDWAKPVLTDPVWPIKPVSHSPRWFTDIDGDGLVDRLADTGVRAFDFNVADVEFTRRYGKHDPRPDPGTGPAQVPFAFDPSSFTGRSLAPSAEARTDTKFYYVDINGDGLVDLVTYNPNDGGGVPRVRPGNGYGEFTCIDSQQPWPCQELPTEVSRIYEINVIGDRTPWPFNDETFFHDVTADGLADIVQYDSASGEVLLWVNQDGHSFACATAKCVAGKTLNAHAESQGLNGSAAWNIGVHRTTFADMNADGIDDIVFLAKPGAYVGTFMKKWIAVTGSDRGSAPRPGLLTRVHNGYGATTDIRYRTIQDLDLAVAGTKHAWQFHSPVVENVVTRLTTQDSYGAGGDLNEPQAPYPFKRIVEYAYQNPAYDRWSRSFSGFRKVIAHYGDEAATTVTSYWFGPCQNNGLDARLNGSEDIPLCVEGSDDDKYKSVTGRVVRVDRGNEFKDLFEIDAPELGPQLLWSKTFHYNSDTLFIRPDRDRQVTFSYPGTIDTYLYDETKPTTPGEVVSTVGGDLLESPPAQTGVRKHLRHVVVYDNRGNLKRIEEYGAMTDEDSKAITVTLYSPKDLSDADGPSSSSDTPDVLPCTSDWQCLPAYVTVWQPQGDRLGNNPDLLLRKSRYTYTPTGDVKTVEGWLDAASHPLERHHPAGNNSIAPPLAGQFLARGWHTLTTLGYDAWGNVTRTIGGKPADGSSPSCSDIVFEEAYQQLPQFVENFVDGCDGLSLQTQSVFDRGFEQVVNSTAPNGSYSEIRYDLFGRTSEVYLPDPDALPGSTSPVLAATITYFDHDPLSYIELRHIVGPGKSTRSVTLLNGLGEPVIDLDQGDNNDWVVKGLTGKNLAGKVSTIRSPWMFTGDPIPTSVLAQNIPVPSGQTQLEIYYDGFGRQVSTREAGVELMRTQYYPLAIETRDAEQLKPGGVHAKAFQRVEFDGLARATKSIVHIENPTTEDIVTAVEYDPVGNPVAITRSGVDSSYHRSMEYDSLGRLIVNKEPNTGNNWRYAWDDAGRLVGTSDARGCGENLYYDGLDRPVGEDFSPCLSSQSAYTLPNLISGKGLEVFYRYDTYEADQVSPEPGFIDDPSYGIGNLVSIQDRGSHTRMSYDARGEVRRISRQLAKPDGLDVDSPYAPHWYTSRLDYDLGDRLTRRTTGVDVPEMIMNGESEARYAYSPRGQLAGIDSSYGEIVSSMEYDPEGAPQRIVYGDSLHTKANFVYDNRHRLKQYQLITPWGPWIEHFNYHYSAYDEVDNPLVIEDVRKGVQLALQKQLLPPEASPVEKRVMEYDDLYRLTKIDNTYQVSGGIAPWQSPFASELSIGDRHPVPLRELPTRIKQQSFAYNGLGNLTSSSDDLSALYDRSLGLNLGYGTQQNGPNQLRSGEGLQVQYDEAGNMTQLKLERPGNCPTGAVSQCAQWFAYDWDEVGQLARARRWDFNGNTLPPQAEPNALPAKKPSWDLTYGYSQGTRVRKTVTDDVGVARHTLEVFDTLRIEHAPIDAAGNYRTTRDNVHAYPEGLAHVFWDADGQLPHQSPDSLITMHLVIGDHLGSSSIILNHANSKKLVERTTYQPYGAVESDYRPAQWKAFREPYKFTGKEEDLEVGATYFGARYYQPYLGRFMSADPLTIHSLGSDLNPYAYVGGRVTSDVDPIGLCTPGAEYMHDGTTTTVTDCPPQNNSDANASHADDMASNARVRQPTNDQSLIISTPPEWEAEDENSGQAASSAGGFRFPRRETNSEIIARTHPRLAPMIQGADREKKVIEAAPIILSVVLEAPGAFTGNPLKLEVGSASDVAWGARLEPAAIKSTVAPALTMSDGYALGYDLGTAGQTAVFGKYPGNIQYVGANPGTYTLDRPWGWTPNYNAGAVRGHLDSGGPIRLTSEKFTGTYKLEVEQILNGLFQ